tara:strand:- start:3036 stop:3521 length:486 start_codon:yes stop_codon:yes gene_type:complete
MKSLLSHSKGFTLVEVMVVIVLLTLSFMIFLQALNTAKEVRAKSEIRTIQSVILASHQNLIRSKQFDENLNWPWSLDLGQDPGEISFNDFNDVDDFKGYQVDALDNYPSFGCNIEVDYVTPETGFHEPVLNQVTSFKRITVSVNHSQLPSLVDTIIIGKGF